MRRIFFSFSGTFLMALLLLVSWPGRAEDVSRTPGMPVATNLLSLRQLTQNQIRTQAGIALEGTIREVNERRGTLVLQDASCAELLELDYSTVPLRAGQIIRLVADACEISRRRAGFGLRRLPLVDNDGERVVQEKWAAVELAAGRHPITVEWFNKTGPAKLAVEYSGPGFARQAIPDTALSHLEPALGAGADRVSPGVFFRNYEGSWMALPDFSQWPVTRSGTSPNFNLDAALEAENVGAVFSGFLTVTQAGNYTLFLSSDDGSRLYLGTAVPRIEKVGETNLPAPLSYYIGQIADTNEVGLWMTFEGAARYVSAYAGRLELEVRSPSNNRLVAVVADAEGLSPMLLLNSQVRLTGIGRPVFSAGDQGIWGMITVASARGVQILDVPAETWAAYPRQEIASIRAAKKLNGVVYFSGHLETNAGRSELQLTDPTGTILVERAPQTLAMLGREVDILGQVQPAGTNQILSGVCVRPAAAAQPPVALPLLTTAQQVLQLSRAEAGRGYPVRLRGVITCVWPDNYRNAVLQDATHGIFLLQPSTEVLGHPQFGEFWEIEGISDAGEFSPMVNVKAMRRIGEGRLPDPAHPELDELINGSLDNQYVEIEGVVIQAERRSLTLLGHWGKVTVNVLGDKPPALEQYENKLVRLRGCLQALWDAATHQVKIGEVQIGNLSINADRSYSADPFAVPARQVQELRQYDLQANAFHRVKISGQFLQRHAGEYFMASGSHGLRFIPNDEPNLRPGDLIEVAGVPDLRGAAPVLREAAARKTGTAILPAATKMTAEHLSSPKNDSTRVETEGVLVNAQKNRAELILEMRSGLRTFAARVLAAGSREADLRAGSQLRLTGVCVGRSPGRNGGSTLDSFELLLASPADIQVLSRPPWWTFKRLLLALALLTGVLSLSGIWIVLLRRQVERRTAQLERANRQREQAERARVVEEERLRIARDLHDDLGSSLTEITMLGSMGLAEPEAERGHTIAQIVKKARDSVNALDAIVWAVNPMENTLQSLADYLAGYAADFLAASAIACRLNLPESFPAVTLDGRTRHDLFLATKEALNNAARHARATEVELSVALDQGKIIIGVRDNGIGFERSAKTFGHGLGNLQSRLKKLGGECQIETVPGGGTSVALRLGLPAGG